MANKKDLRKFIKDLNRRRTFRSAFERSSGTKVKDVVVEKTLKRKEERMKDCMECKYSEQCSAEMKDAHGYFLVDTCKICTYIISHVFRKAFPHLTAGK